MTKLTYIDYSIIGAYLGGMVVLGAMFSRRQKSLSEYFHAGGKIPWWAAGISILATGLSPISYLAGPGWIFEKDSRYSIVMTLLGFPAVIAAIYLWVPLWSRLRVMSIYEYLERRFDPGIRTFGAVMFFVGLTFWLGTALVTSAMGFETVSGFPGRLCLVIIVVLGTAYTVLGGMRAVIWTDVVQYVIFMVGYGAIFLVLLSMFDWQPMEIYRVASTKISETGYPHTKLISFELDPNVEATIWVLLFSRLFTTLHYGADQMAVQRMHSTGSPRNMAKAMLGGHVCVLFFSLLSLPAAWGFVAYYHLHPEEAAQIAHTDQVLPQFVIKHLPVILRSLIMAGVLAALMSSFDSAINSMSNIAISDFYRRYVKRDAQEHELVVLAKAMTVFFALLLMTFALFQYDLEGDTAGEKLGKLGNVIAAPVLSFFLLGLLTKRANTGGALIGAVAGVGFAVVFNGIPGVIEKRLDWINWMWVGGLATVFNLLVGYLASFLFPPPAKEDLAGLTVYDRASSQRRPRSRRKRLVLIIAAVIALACGGGFAVYWHIMGAHDRFYTLLRMDWIYRGCLEYADTRNGKYPDDLATLYHRQGGEPASFFSLMTDKQLPADFNAWPRDQRAQWLNANSSYVLLPNGDDIQPGQIIIFQKLESNHPKIAIMFKGRWPTWVKINEARELISEQTGISLDQWSD